MKARTPFWPLLKNELDLGRAAGTGQVMIVLLVYWGCVGAFPSMILFGQGWQFENGIFFILAFLHLSVLTVWLTYATVPSFCDLLSPGGGIPGAVQYFGAFEFLFTRPVDRKTLYRARTAALFLFALTPLLVNVAASPLAPAINFGSGGDGRRETFLKALKLDNRNYFDSSAIIAPHGALAYTAWLAWGATFAFVLLQGYATFITPRIKADRWWTALFAGGPIFFALVSLIVTLRISARNHRNLCEEGFLFFASHPLGMLLALVVAAGLVQIWCERRFSKLEIL